MSMISVVGFGLMTDISVYSIIIPVLPFRLEALGYSGVSSLVGWLLFAFSGGLVVSTIPVAMLSERYKTRRVPFIIGTVTLLGSQVMLMEAPSYGIMCFARILQGISSSMVWVVGLALLCDTVSENRVGRQLGIAMTGMSIGFVIGPPVGGLLYGRLGYRAPFVFSEICTILDLVGRLLIIERKYALEWGVDPAAVPTGKQAEAQHALDDVDISDGQLGDKDQLMSPHSPVSNASPAKAREGEVLSDAEHGEATIVVPVKPLSLHVVVIRLVKSSRALVALSLSLVWGLAYSCQETTLPLHLQAVWNLDSAKVGLVMLAAVFPTIISSPLTGWLADKGAEWPTLLCLLLAIPWWIVIILQPSLSLFIVAFVIENFFTSGVIPPVIAELAAVSRNVDGIGYAHVYGALNLAYGMGTTIGPIIGGEVYEHTKHGWTAICLLAAGLLALCLLLSFGYTGADPLAARLHRSIGRQQILENSGRATTLATL
ncbi:hypothetical protein PILCRDRAFT_6257 [Piloderma croceum F 1598]|uniref:Major facilitator superfamily (MFS) profile domain-containing protein n=1 Tax=Piloderma croceum (strain F 1598) TaxID=765440 RepID=A0A0C3G240_PILCF|nr:hypothetical protein PILCRDRAFT_6257 [Piloderma croceum F 1598]